MFDRRATNELCSSGYDASTVVGVVNKLDRKRVFRIDLPWQNFLSP